LVENWAKESSQNHLSLTDIPAVVQQTTSEVAGDTTIFVFSSPTPDDPALEPYPLVAALDDDRNNVDILASSSDKVAPSTAAADVELTPSHMEAPTETPLLPLIGACIAALLVVGIVTTIVAIIGVLKAAWAASSRSDEESNVGVAKTAVDAKVADMTVSTEKVLNALDASHRLVQQKPSPNTIPLPEPTPDEEESFASQVVLPTIAPLNSQLHSPLVQHEQALPIQVALLLPWMSEGLMLRFFLVLFGWWSILFGGAQAF